MAHRQETCQFGHNEWYKLERGERQCAVCARERKRAKQRCANGHKNWVQGSGKKRVCLTCMEERKAERLRRHTSPKNGAWVDWSRQGDRGPREDTFCYSEIMEARGYGK